MTKSYVSLEQKVCLVCAKTFDSGAVLLDRRLKDSMNHTTVTGWDLCPDDKARYDDGYIALVEARPTLGDRMQPDEAYRLGRIAHIREKTFDTIFNVPARNERGVLQPVMFVQSEVMDMLEEMASKGGGSR